jgi:hypothetical protein
LGTALVEVARKLTPQVILRGAVSAVFVNPQAVSYAGECGVNLGF